MKKLPQVAIVGYPNVGKSTLFNRLLKKRKALVHSLPGMTRDPVSSPCQLGEKKFLLVDTGGFLDAHQDPFSPKVREKAWEAARKAGLILFMLDGKREILPDEEEFYFSLKKLGKPLLVIVNKIDSEDQEERISEFYRLGEERILSLSAEHKRNLRILEEAIIELLPEEQAVKEMQVRPLRIAIVGRINVGKSSIVNRLCGEERLIVSEIPGTTRDSTDTLISRNRKAFCLVDTAGIRKMSRAEDKREKAAIIKAKQNIADADVVCLVLDALEFPTRQDATIAQLASESGKPLLIALNKWDLVVEKSRAAFVFRERVFSRLHFVNYAPLIYVSALTGKGVIRILDLAEKIYENSHKRIETSRLNEFLEWIRENHPPLTRERKRVKLRYMTQKDIHPPSFILFINRHASFLPAYEKFFLEKLRHRFDFWGTPLRLILRVS